MKDLRALLIDCRIELRKLVRDFHKTELCERLDVAVQSLGNAEGDKPGLFVSSVRWAPVGGMLVAANSCGAVKIMEMTTPRA